MPTKSVVPCTGVLAAIVAVCLAAPALAQGLGLPDLTSPRATPARIVERIDDTRLTKLAGNVHPLARPEFDRGAVAGSRVLDRMVLVLTRSAEQQAELTKLNEEQYDPKSPLFHHWLHADEIGQRFGPSDADITQITGWLTSHGFQVNEVSKGRVTIDFSGSAAQVQNAFHTEIHHYVVGGKDHLANASDPQIPSALAPVIAGVFSLNDFRHKHQSMFGGYIKRDRHTGNMTRVEQTPGVQENLNASTPKLQAGSGAAGAKPQLGYPSPETGYTIEDLTPYDIVTVYNILPLWNAGTNGTGVTIAIVGISDITLSDVATFRKSFGLSAGVPKIIVNGPDPGELSDGGQSENTLDVEMAGATAPGAQIDLVVSANTSSTSGDVLSAMYIIDHEVAPVASGSYGECELNLGSAGNSLYNQLWQQAATAGISVFESAGDQGSAGCSDQDDPPPNYDTTGLQVNGIASSPYITAVGGTDFTWSFTEASTPISTYWNASNDPTTLASAKGYIPEVPWNATCTNPLLLNVFTDGSGKPFPNTESLCNAAYRSDDGLIEISSGSGGVSHCTTPTGNTSASCTGGYAKPSWQTGPGVPSDGKRDLPDVSLFASAGFYDSTGIASSRLLFCQASNSPQEGCDYSNPDYIIYQEVGGTSASSPMTAGIMALVVQKTGASQGLANPIFYQLAAGQNTSACNSTTVAAGNSCIFYDTTQGTNSQACATGDPDCVTNTSGDQLGELSGYNSVAGYDLGTGLGTPNVTNLVNAWPTTTTVPSVSVSPTTYAFAAAPVNSSSSTKATITVENTGTASVSFGGATLTGTDTTSFSETTNCPMNATLATGASCTFIITFTPSQVGSLSATLNISDGAGTQTVALTGTSTAAPTYTVSLAPTSLSFPSTTVGSTSATQVVTVTNTSSAALTLTSTNITGANVGSFLISSSTCGTSLTAASSCTISVAFKPLAAGSLAASLAVTDNASGSPQTVALSGTGTAAATYTVSLAPSSLSFASTTIGTTSALQSVNLTNTGTGSISISSIALAGANASSFLISSSTCGTSLAAAASCTISLAFKPTAAGSLAASLAIADNATGSPQTVALAGTATAATTYTVSLSPGSLSFPSTTVGSTSVTEAVALKNTGSGPVSLTSTSILGANGSSFLISSSTCGTSLAAAASCTISIAFKPTAAASLSASLSIADNATGSPQTVALAGTATAATTYTVSLSPGSLSFPSTTVGSTSATQTITLTNTGSGAVSLSSTTITGANSSSFFVSSSTCSKSLAIKASCAFAITFKPTAAGSLTASLAIADNATGSPQTVALSGTGTAAGNGMPQLQLSNSFSTQGNGSYLLTLTMTNSGTGAAMNAVITGLVVGGYNGTPLPQTLGNIAPGGSAVATFAVPASAGIANSSVVEKVSGTYTGGTITGSYRTTLP